VLNFSNEVVSDFPCNNPCPPYFKGGTVFNVFHFKVKNSLIILITKQNITTIYIYVYILLISLDVGMKGSFL